MKNSIVVRILTYMLSIMITLIQANIGFPMGSYRKPENKGLYFYSSKEISDFLKNIGCQTAWTTASWETLRNADGTELRFSDNKRRKIIALSCDGSIKEIDMPGYPAWLDEKHEAIAWHDQNKGMVYYKNGTYEKIAKSFSPHVGPDPSGNYFMKGLHAPPLGTPLSEICKTEIYSIERPDISLATIRDYCASNIFFKDGKVYLFGKDYGEKSNSISGTITMHVFQVMNSGLIEIETKTIETTLAGMHVTDFSPWDEKIFFIKDYDPPFRSVLYEFDFGTREMKKIGKMPFSGGRGFYLQCDILKVVTEKFNISKLGRSD
jgi:hypothetical protein